MASPQLPKRRVRIRNAVLRIGLLVSTSSANAAHTETAAPGSSNPTVFEPSRRIDRFHLRVRGNIPTEIGGFDDEHHELLGTKSTSHVAFPTPSYDVSLADSTNGSVEQIFPNESDGEDADTLPLQAQWGMSDSLRYRELQELPTTIPSLRLHHKKSLAVASGNIPNNHGWTPDSFPNPAEDPVRCGILALEVVGEDEETFLDGDAPDYPLLLCDPDSVLGYIFLEKIALSLRNFTNTFGSGMARQREVEMLGNSKQILADHSLGRGDAVEGVDTSAGYGGTVSSQENTSVRGGEWRVLATSFSSPESSRDRQMQTNSLNQMLDVERKTKGMSTINIASLALTDDYVPPLKRALDTGPLFTVAGGTFGPSGPDTTSVEIAVAVVRKMNLQAVLQAGAYYSYEDEDDMVNDAAQYFARSLHDVWWDGKCSAANGCTGDRMYGILIFLSVNDRVCFISTGPAISAILPWWRLEHVVSNMKPYLRRREYGKAILNSIDDLAFMLNAGPPTLADRINDFFARFGVVIAFATFTFLFATWGEYRDRRKRWRYAELRSRLTNVEKENARLLQRQYHTRSCPICLESFDFGDFDADDTKKDETKGKDDKRITTDKSEVAIDMQRVDSYGIPLRGSDGLPLKMLRCGHIFDESCWKCWVHSGHGNPCKCPVCRQDVGGKNQSSRNQRPVRRLRSLASVITASTDNENSPVSQTTPLNRTITHPSYDAVVHTRADRPPGLTGGEESPWTWGGGSLLGSHPMPPDYPTDISSIQSPSDEEAVAFVEHPPSSMTESDGFVATD